MKLFRNTHRKKTSKSSPASRRQSKDAAFAQIVPQSFPKRPSVTMLPRDSASSLPMSPPPAVLHRRLTSYNPKRPNLQEILSGRSTEPWTLAAFTAYCEQNLCLENLLFIQAAEKYTNDHKEWTSAEDRAKDIARLIRQWHQMLSQFIATGGPREVNLTGDVRDALLAVEVVDAPGDPILLVPAVNLTHRLIEDSILFPFLNENRPRSDSEPSVEEVHEDIRSKSHSVQGLTRVSRPSSRELSSPLSAASNHSNIFAWRAHAGPTSSPQRSGSRPKSMFSAKEHSRSSGGTSLDTAIADDSNTNLTSPSMSQVSIRSPPMSPPGELGVHSPRTRSDSGWRKLGAKLGFKKRQSETQLRSATSSAISESPS